MYQQNEQRPVTYAGPVQSYCTVRLVLDNPNPLPDL